MVVALAVLLGVSAPAALAAEPTGVALPSPGEREAEADPDDLGSRVTEVRGQLEAVVRRLHEAETRSAQLEAEVARVDAEVAATAARVTALREQLASRLRAAYTSGMSDEPLIQMFTSSDPTATLDKLALLGSVSRSDDQLLADSVAAAERLALQQAEARRLRDEGAAARDGLQREQTEVTRLLDSAVAAEQAAAALSAQRAAEAERASRDAAAREAASGPAVAGLPAPVGGAFACPVGPLHQFSDTFGAPRSGGRSHQGVDIFAPYGSPIYAVEGGTIARAYSNSLGGLAIMLRGDSGDQYYYAHQSANLVAGGQRVVPGQHIAAIGTTGNAAGTAPHLHFERWPGGGGAANPTPFVSSIC